MNAYDAIYRNMRVARRFDIPLDPPKRTMADAVDTGVAWAGWLVIVGLLVWLAVDVARYGL